MEIWTLSLWDLKQRGTNQEDTKPNIWTLSLWDLKQDYSTGAGGDAYKIWTLSLWDLKPISVKT